jgi:hypothetical protein
MINSNAAEDLLTKVEAYYRLFDSGQAFMHLFDENAEIWFPKWGVTGPGEVPKLFSDLGGHIAAIEHVMDQFKYYVAGDVVIVEGQTRGRLANGESWSNEPSAQGKFCSVFTFEAGVIKKMWIYLDPDYADQTNSLYAWLT